MTPGGPPTAWPADPEPRHDAPAPAPTAPTANDRIRSRLATTPGRLRLASLAIVVVVALAWLVTAAAVRARQAATRQVGRETEPLLVGVQAVDANLADADATAATAFVTGGLEPKTLRDRYDADIKQATDGLTDVTRQIGSSADALAAARAMTEQLPVYTGLVESGRANNRQLLPVGAAYLRAASALMQKQILVEANQLYQVEAKRLDGSYRAGASPVDVAGVLAAGAALLAILVLTQLYLTGRTNRIINVPLLAATVVAVILTGWVVADFGAQHHHLALAQRNGSDPVEVVAQARILDLRAESDESLTLVGRGGITKYTDDLEKVIIPQLRGLIQQAGAGDAASAYQNLVATHGQVKKLENAGNYKNAADLSAGQEFAPLNSALVAAVGRSQEQFVTESGSATKAFQGMSIGIAVLALAIGLLALFGTQQRINDYR